MSIELDLDSVNKFEGYTGVPFFQPSESLGSLHQAIFSNPHADIWNLPKGATHNQSPTFIEGRTRAVFESKVGHMKPMDAGGSGKVEIKYEWGDKNGGKFSGSAKAEAHDDNGNSVEIKVEKGSDGSGSVSVSAGHESESDEG